MHRLVVGNWVVVSAEFKRKGQPAPLEGLPVWTSSNPAVADVIASADGATAKVRAIGPGDCQITVSCPTKSGLLTAPPVGIRVDLPQPAATLTSAPEKVYDALGQFIGQEHVKSSLMAKIRASKEHQIPLPHLLLSGPADSGKTTFARCIVTDLGVPYQHMAARLIKKPADLLPFLTNAADGSILIIEDIDSMADRVCDFLEPALAESRIDVLLGEGVFARTIVMPLKRFTVIATTSKQSRIEQKLLRWFGVYEFKRYAEVEFCQWVSTLANRAGLCLPQESLQIVVDCCAGSLLHASALVKKLTIHMQDAGVCNLAPENLRRVLSWLGYEQRRTHPLTLTDRLNAMTGPQFEEFVRRLFRAKGYMVEITGMAGDHGIDLIMEQMGSRKVVQCKRWNDSVGEPEIRDFYGAMMNCHAEAGFFVTTSRFTQAAETFAKGKPITLVDMECLLQMAREMEFGTGNVAEDA